MAMSKGLKIVLPMTFTDSSLPVLSNDAILSKGSLLLIDPTHPLETWPTGVPADNVALPNIAAEFASKLISGNIGPTLVTAAGMSGGFERTTKGGLHARVGATQTAQSGLNMVAPTSIIEYMVANQSHEFYVSMWSYVTTPGTVTSTAEVQGQIHRAYNYGGAAYPRGGVFSLGSISSRIEPKDSNRSGFFADNLNAIGSRLMAVAGTPNAASSAADPTMKASDYTDAQFRALVSMGPANAESKYSAVDQAKRLQSWVLYRLYIEDLTVSGRTFDAVSEIDKQLYNKELKSSGGRYYGDTWTADPA
ncbi:TPA: hypothetical protein ACGD69_003368 [Serratia marcescens]|uniref:hypothetical protein n=1 Tax=Serratia marcescens TaxID=615 RepID=UPI0011508B6E|nr:hypothetical protein [Serratia marcescens]MBH3263645.1 hypothetical protein [Serratia marcescens]QDI15297.1 hypothetical protein FBF84_19965 [Serratia marcescens]QDI25038.1 hypothetical protein FBF90_19955 [Serratia marcescens]HEM7575944.1 hypothetical protein [Serratia marcescens]